MGRLKARLADSEVDRELGRHVAEAQRSLRRAIEVCSQAPRGSRRKSDFNSPAETRRIDRLRRRAANEPSEKRSQAMLYQAEQMVHKLTNEQAKQALSQLEEAAVSSRRAEDIKRKLVQALNLLDGNVGRLRPYSNDPDLVSEDTKFPGWHNQTLFKGKRIEVLENQIFVDGIEYVPLVSVPEPELLVLPVETDEVNDG